MENLKLLTSAGPDRGARTRRLATTICALLAVWSSGAQEAFASADQIGFAGQAYVDDAAVRLRDVADVSSLPVQWRDAAALLVVATMPDRQEQLDIPTGELARAVRRQMPGLSPWFDAKKVPSGIVAVRRSTQTATRTSERSDRDPRACMRIAAHVPAHAAIRVTDIDSDRVPCESAALRRVAYTRDAHLVRAVDELSPGELIAALPVARLASARRGDPVAITTAAGGITVTRKAVAEVDEAVRYNAASTSSPAPAASHSGRSS